MRYLEKKFSVGGGGSAKYRDGWDKIFSKPPRKTALAWLKDHACPGGVLATRKPVKGPRAPR